MKREAFRVLSGAALAICLIAVPPATAAKAATLPTAYAPQLTRYPYLTDVAGGGATINWATDRSSASAYVTWGAAGVESCTAHSKSASRTQITVGSTPEYQWKARLALAPDTTYCYRVVSGGHGIRSQPARLESLAAVRHRASRRFDDSVQVRRARRLGLRQRRRQPRPGEPDRPARLERGAVRALDRRYRLSGREPGELRRSLPDRSQRQRGVRSSVLDCGRRLDAALPRSWKPRLERELPADLAGCLGGRRLQWTLPDRQLLLPERDGLGEVPERLVRVRRGARAVLHAGRRLGELQPRHGQPLSERLRLPLDPRQPGVPVARARPRHPSRAGQVRDLPLPALLGQRDRDLGRLPSRSEQPGRSAQPLRGRHRLQRSRPHLRAQQREWPRRPDQLRDRGRRRTPGAGQQVQRPPRHRRLRDRLVEFLGHGQRLWQRVSARFVESGLPLPAGQRRLGTRSPSPRRTRWGAPSTARPTYFHPTFRRPTPHLRARRRVSLPRLSTRVASTCPGHRRPTTWASPDTRSTETERC